jgi:hypothetical protein
MRKWLYVQATVNEKDIYDGDPAGISFSHTFVEADDVDDAYFKGMKACPERADDDSEATVMNDYVVEVTSGN